MELHIGLDDVDSPKGGCTTYLGYLIARYLKSRGAEPLDLPYLVRLNPNVPAKTRGNGAVSFHVKVEDSLVEEIVRGVEAITSSAAERHGKTSPGLLVASGDALSSISIVYSRALNEYLPRSYVEELLEALAKEGKVFATAHRGRGLVGAAAAVGAFPLREFTYELLLYASKTHVDRRALESTLVELDREYRPLLFATYDYAEKRPLALPRGPTPVVAGLRAVDPDVLLRAAKILEERFGLREWIIYKTNQATRVHLSRRKRISQVRPYDSVVVRGRVSARPVVLRGGHVKVVLCDESGCLAAMFYWETGRLRHVARLLEEGDLVEIGGGVVPRWGLTLNAEYVRVIEVKPREVIQNPLCPRCGARMESAGRGKGFKCPKCGFRAREVAKVRRVYARILEPGEYVASPRAYRHLTQPQEIRGLEARDAPPAWLIGEG